MKRNSIIVPLIIGIILGTGIGFSIKSNETSVYTLTKTITQSSTITTRTQVQGGGGLLQYCFSPGGDCKSYIIYWIERANTSIHILIYSFTLDDVSDALINARNRGVDVKVVMEGDNIDSKGSEYYNLQSAGVDIRHDTRSALMHDKLAIIDNHIIITGSFNWTASANNSNNENLIVIDSDSWASAFEHVFQDVYISAIP